MHTMENNIIKNTNKLKLFINEIQTHVIHKILIQQRLKLHTNEKQYSNVTIQICNTTAALEFK